MSEIHRLTDRSVAQLGESVRVRLDDLAALIADRTRINLDLIVNYRQLAQQRSRDVAIGRDDDFVSD